MDTQTIKQKILSGEMTDVELKDLISNKANSSHTRKHNSGFLKTILKGFIEGYTAPNMYRATLEALLILLIITGVVILSYVGRIDAIVTSVLLAFVLGFLFGKFK